MFMGSLRKQYGEEGYGRYFLVKRRVPDLIRESIGLLNGKVGYTYLVDAECRIRWAASGPSTPDEMDGFTRGMQKLAKEAEEAQAAGGAARTAAMKRGLKA